MIELWIRFSPAKSVNIKNRSEKNQPKSRDRVAMSPATRRTNLLGELVGDLNILK